MLKGRANGYDVIYSICAESETKEGEHLDIFETQQKN